jgi:predicted transposase YbfD/YdcC
VLKPVQDYILPVKDNQGTLYEDMSLLFDGFEADEYTDVLYDTAKRVMEDRARRKIRQCWVVQQPEYRAYLRRGQDWSDLTSLVKLLTIRQTATKTEVTSCYFISRWTATAQAFLKGIQEHWQIENGLHWVLDIAFREDESRIRKDHAPQNMAVLRHMALNLLKQETSVRWVSPLNAKWQVGTMPICSPSYVHQDLICNRPGFSWRMSFC